MVYKEHLIELWVDGNKVELEDQKSINVRINNVLLDITKVSSTQTEYSFEFEIPMTKKNNVIFNYANNLSKLGKFHQRYNAEMYCDGFVIFSGTITLNGYKDGMYNVNLVSVKVYSLDEIFGDSLMTDIDNWKIDFDGAATINEKNESLDADVVFPLVSYGVFAKDPYELGSVNSYTSKFDFDEWNRWYIESFYPSHNMLQTLKHAFEYKGYTVNGDIFNDEKLKNIYMSVNLADGQVPIYNVGNPRFGTTQLSATITTTPRGGYSQELTFPYYMVYAAGATSESITSSTQYNFTNIEVYDILAEGEVTLLSEPSYMYQPNENCIVIPADGFYRIDMYVTSYLQTLTNLTVKQYTVDMVKREMSESEIEIPVGYNETTPIEIQLVKNYSDNIELIKGKKNRQYADGNQTHETYSIGVTRPNIVDWVTCFPHEDPYSATIPTKMNDLKSYTRNGNFGGNRAVNNSSFGASYGGTRGATTRGGTISLSGSGRSYSPLNYGYVYNDNEIMCYDQAVSDAFICGFSTMSDGVMAVMKDGYSWSKITSEKNEAFYNENGYSFYEREEVTGNDLYTKTNKYSNTYNNSPRNYVSTTNRSLNGNLFCMVYLKKNDILSLKEIHRGYENMYGAKVGFQTITNVTLKVEAYSPNTYYHLKTYGFNDYYHPKEFDTKLNLANFFNKEKKISEWVQNILDAYNFELRQDSNVITINKKKFETQMISAIDIDDRVNSANAEVKQIDYPKSMAIKYKIDTDEWGAEKSAIETYGDDTIMNNESWKEYIDSGFTEIMLNDDSYVSSKSEKNLQFSYTWYDNFNWYAVNSGGTKESDNSVMLKIPVISKYSYMIDGYDYEESAKHDGYGLTQRFWFKPRETNAFVWTETYPKEMVKIYEPINLLTNYSDLYFNLSYKNTERSLLTEYFNIQPYLNSNYVEIEIYLSPEEYRRIKNGSLVKFDSDLYYTIEITSYDPTGYNPTTLKLMKKVV